MIRLVVVLTLVAAALARPQLLHGLTFSPVQAAAPTAQYTLPSALGTHVTTSQQAAQAIPAVPPTNFVQGTAADGSNVFGYQTIDGQSRQESVGADGSVRGSYSYIDPNGQPITVNYVADQQGFRTSLDPVPAGGAATARPVATAPAVQPATFQTVPAVQQAAYPAFTFPGFTAVTQAPAPVAPAPAPAPQSFTSFYSPLPATTLPLSHITQSPASTGLSHFGFQPVAVQQQPAVAAQPAPQPIAYSFNTGR